MNIGVFLKPILDTNMTPCITEALGGLDLGEYPFVINPFDEYALEEALLCREVFPLSKITCLGAGNDAGKMVMRRALSLGVDGAVFLTDPDIHGHLFENFALAKAFADRAMDYSFDLIFMGKESADTGNGVLGSMIACLLGMPVITNVNRITYAPGCLDVYWETDLGYTEHIRTTMPCLITVAKGINKPRYPTISGILSAKRSPILEFPVEANESTSRGSGFCVMNYSYPKRTAKCQLVAGDTAAAVAENFFLIVEKTIKVGVGE